MLSRMLTKLERVAERLNGSPSETLEGVNQFELRDRGDHRFWYLAPVEGRVTFQAGRHAAPDVTVTLTEEAVDLIAAGADLQDPSVLSDIEVSGDASKIFPLYLLDDEAPSWLAWAREVSARHFDIPSAIERVPAEPAAVDAAISKGVPFVIRATEAPSWTLDGLERDFGALPATLLSGARTVAESLQRIRAGKTVDGAYRAPEAMIDAIGVPAFLAKRLDGRPKLFLGPKGGVTPAHRDNSPGLAWHLIGRKRWLFLPPSYADRVSIRGAEASAEFAGVDFDSPPDGDRPPLFAGIKPVEITVEPGESVYLPALWFHQVHQVDVTVSVSYFVLNDGSPSSPETRGAP